MALPWVAIVLGIWLIVSPWLMGVSGLALWSNLLVGMILVLVGAWELFGRETNN